MLKRVILVIALALPMLAAGQTPLALAQGDPTVLADTTLPLSERVKFPHIDTLGSNVYVSGNAERSVARLWSKADTASTFAGPQTLGAAAGYPDYSSTAIFVSDAGVINYAWINEQERRIYIRSKGPSDADYRPAVVVYNAAQPYEVEVAANDDGVFVFWREVDRPIKYLRSRDGLTWDGPARNVMLEAVNGGIDVAAGAGSALAVAYYRGDRETDKLQSYLAIWNGSGFVSERIPTARDKDFVFPSVALRPDGGWAVALRGSSELRDGLYVGDRLPSGAWDKEPLDRIIRGEVLYTAVDIDPLGDAHLFWLSSVSGRVTLYYAYRRPGQAYGGIASPQQPVANPLQVAQHSDQLFATRVAASLRDRSYGHVALERFDGGITSAQYALVGLPVALVGASGVSIESGAARTSLPSVRVTFSGITGNPSEVRWRWGQAPLASDPFVPFDPANPTITVPLPAGANPNCSSLTLYTQLKSGLYVQLTPSSDTIILDQAVQASLLAIGAPPTLDPGYTPSLNATLLVYSAADCSGIATAQVSGSLEGGSLSLPVLGKPLYEQQVRLTGGPGLKEFSLIATDLAGNTTTSPVTRTLIYDPEPPTLTSVASEGESSIVPNPDGTTVLSLALDNLVASDSGGVLAGIELQIVSPAVSGVTQTSDPVRILFRNMDQATTNGDGSLSLRETVDLADFFAPADLVPGTYRFQVRVLDAAGNASPLSQAITRSETLTAITYPAFAPFVRR
ncbi:MAG: hypothetical protein HGA45_27960 [Chloroflexales bacterium]|nr:hypothetical protein [Chloroflexales bacterium]